MKKLLILTLLGFLLLCTNITVYVADQIQVFIDGKAQTYEQPPLVVNVNTFVPIRPIFEPLNGTVWWLEKENAALVVKGSVCLLSITQIL